MQCFVYHHSCYANHVNCVVNYGNYLLAEEACSGPAGNCRVCDAVAETTKCLHCSKMVCETCKQAHTGAVIVQSKDSVNKL